MTTRWWNHMPLDVWTTELAIPTVDRSFALALAEERARVRGIRQRVSRAVDQHGRHWLVQDVAAPRELAS
jgi:hypothetical protein